MMSVITKPFTAEQIARGDTAKMTEKQKRQQKQYEKFKAQEQQNYKEFHRNILRDDGIPKLKKTTFRMPGYRKILSDN